jgi:hypothetical protein
MRPDSRTDSDHSDDHERAQPVAYPVFTGDREPADIPAPRHGENPFGTPPGGYAAPPEPVDEFDHASGHRPHDHDEHAAHGHDHGGAEYPPPVHAADGADAHTGHTEDTGHTFADADARADRRDHDGSDAVDPDEVAVGRATVPDHDGAHPDASFDPDERVAVASTTPTPDDFAQAHAVSTDPVHRDDLDVQPVVLHGTGTDTGTDRTTDLDADRPGGYHDNTAGTETADEHAAAADEHAAAADEHATAADEYAAAADAHEDTADDTARTADDTVIAPTGLKPGDAEVAPVPTFWAATDTDGYRDRWREAQLRFVDDPKGAADEIRGLVGEATEAVAEALTAQRRDLDGWSAGGDGPRDTEELRVVIQRYRTFFDRLLKL